jgi:ABC-2 type transport system permease protein
MNTMKWLLKREYWEHKGGLLWAPGVVSAITVVLALIMAAAFTYAIHSGNIDDNGVRISSVAQMMNAEEAGKTTEAMSGMFLVAIAPLMSIFFFVVFFYLLGALYDDRSNRSILFWKSMPVSDKETVGSKLITALVVAPLLTLAIATVASFVLAIIGTITLALNGGGHIAAGAWTSSSLYTLPLAFLGTLPVYAVWSLPTVGWLLMVSAWARRVPFLWAVGTPVITGVLVSWASWIVSIFHIDLPLAMFWKHVVGRLLLSVLPGSWAFLTNEPNRLAADAMGHGSPLASSWAAMATPEMWIGAAAGIAMIVVAIRLRRFRDEG